MPALPSVPNVVRFDHHFVISEDLNARCRLFLLYSGTPPTNLDCENAAINAMTLMNTNLKGLAGVDTHFEYVVCTDLSSPTAGVGTSTNTPFAGTRAGGVLPASTCMLTSFPIHRRYRGGHPRVYWPFGTQSDMSDEQTWLPALVSQVNTDVGTYIAALISAGIGTATFLSQQNVSYYHGFTNLTGSTGRERAVNTPRSTAVLDTILGLIAQTGIAIVRKRLLGIA